MDRPSAGGLPDYSALVRGGLELFGSLGPLGRAGVQFAATLVLAAVVLGILHGYGTRTVDKARRSPVISICIGLPGLLVLGGLSGTGYLIVGTSLGTFFGIPLVVLGVTALPTLSVLGFVSIGRTIAARFGRDRLSAGVLVGALLAGVSALSLPVAVVVTALAAALGIGAGARVLIGAGGTTSPNERTVPPANEI